ncbi:hypothetical protein Tco_1167323 [Tanacetum coccineum]
MDFPEFYKELEAEFLGAGTKLMGLQLLQLELRLGKIPSRSFRPVKSAEILWQFLDIIFIKGFTCSRWFLEQVFAIGKRHLPIESIIASRSTDVMVEPQ